MANDSRPPGGGSDELTPLQRYLAKQKAEGGAATNATTPRPKEESRERKSASAVAEEYGVPASPPGVTPPPPRGDGSAPSTELGRIAVPADFWPRAAAFILDTIIVSAITAPVGYVFGFVFFFLPFPDLLGNLARLVVIFFYFGWFYSEKGATPGKMLLQLEIMETGTHRRLGYVRTFLRETIGKLISSAILFIGFIIVAFRADRMALHDMIFDTRVVKRTKAKAP